jgi:hypothetical protein
MGSDTGLMYRSAVAMHRIEGEFCDVVKLECEIIRALMGSSQQERSRVDRENIFPNIICIILEC